MNQVANTEHTGSYHSCNSTQDSGSSHVPSMSSNIHVNPLICGSRNIYVNKALYLNNPTIGYNPSNSVTSSPSIQCQGIVEKFPSFPNQINVVKNKSERVYYNPKFFKNPINVMKHQVSTCQMIGNKDFSKKHETNIYLNPHFMKNENSLLVNRNISAQKDIPSLSNILNKSKYKGGIHFNPKFLQDNVVISKNDEIVSSLEKTLENQKNDTNVSFTSSLKHRYISKYKIIRKKSNPPITNSPSNIKINVKKINVAVVRKYKFKANRYKLIYNNTTYPYLNKYSFKKSLSGKAQLNSYKKIKKFVLDSQKPVTKIKESPSSESKIFKLNSKKSILQQKIEARRKGKSLFTVYGFKNYLLNSKYKYRRIPEPLKFCEISPKSHYNKHHFHNSDKKVINGTTVCDKSVFKTISKLKLVRKSILQAQIESRHYAKKSFLLLQRTPKKVEGQISMYKIVRPEESKKNPPSNKRIASLKRNPMIFSSNKYRIDKLKRLHILTKTLRKNNQPCSFYNRYGRCKGKEKGSCPKVHDPKYIAICKKFLKGDCKDDSCTLSHDIRPEKMPTCHHYLAGLCIRTNCPYLHIKVNQKAPVCRAFLQGFCSDVYNCNKRHEFICPIYAEKGHCSKGKSCSLPHRTPKTYSKLLEPDQFPLLNIKPQKQFKSEVSKTGKRLAFKEKVNGKDNTSNKVDLKQTKGKEFQRYFLSNLPVSEATENDNENLNITYLDRKDDILHNKCK